MEFNNKKYKYFIDFFNTTYENERIIEIPIISDYFKQVDDRKILEIGNVLSNYMNVKYDILDKYDKNKGLINVDIIDYAPEKKYDLIVSISTFEHIGFDEVVWYSGDKKNVVYQNSLIKAIENTKKLLSQNGIFIFTAPLGFNSFLDEQLIDNKLNLTEMFFLKRISEDNIWVETNFDEIKGVKYGTPYPCANGLLIGLYINN